MPHQWTAFEYALKVGEKLKELNLIKEKDELQVRGILQIMLEDNYRVTRLR